MGIKSITTDVTGQIGDKPRRVKLITTDSLATITTAGYLNSENLMGNSIYPTDILDVWYDYVSNANPGDYGVFTVTISAGTITLDAWENPGNVTGPTVVGHFATFNNTAGQIEDAGYLPSDETKTKVVTASAAVLANHIACFSDVAGTVNDDSATAINGGNIQAGLSGTAGTLISFPSTAANGSLIISALNAGADFTTTIRNSTMGQSSVISIPDPGAATANFLVAPSALVNNNLVKASGTGGRIVDAGARIVANTSGAYAGGGTSNAFTATGLTSAAVGSAVIRTSTNAVSIAKAVPGTDTLTVTFSADPGAGTTVDYIYVTASQA